MFASEFNYTVDGIFSITWENVKVLSEFLEKKYSPTKQRSDMSEFDKTSIGRVKSIKSKTKFNKV